MESLIQTITSFFIVMGIAFTSLIIVTFVLKAKGVSFVEFFLKSDKLEVSTPTSKVISNTVTKQNNVNTPIDRKKVAAIISAIEHHNKTQG